MSDAPAPRDPSPQRCAQCDALLPATPVSICPYCATPVEGPPRSAPEGEGVEAPNAGRIARILEHEDFPVALEWTPPEGPEYRAGSRRILQGELTIAAGALLAGPGWIMGRTLGIAMAGAGLLLAGLGVWLVSTGVGIRRRVLTRPLLRRAGVILERRSETNIGAWSGSTTYYFKIELEGGVVAEFAYPGRGYHEDPYPNNLPGVAYTRGQTLLHFKHIRV